MVDDILFRIRGDENADALYVVAGNPHTQRGLISLVPVGGGLGFSARFTELDGVNETSRGWLRGYASGNEPSFSPSEFPSSRVDREWRFYHDNGYPLAIESSGLVCINLVRDARGVVDRSGVYAVFAGALEAIRACVGKELRWIPILDNGVLVDPISGTGSEEIKRWFNRLNVQFQAEGMPERWNLRLLARSEGHTFDSFEVNFSFEYESNLVYMYGLSLNLDAELASLEADDIESVSGWLRSLFVGLVQAVPADSASISPSRVAKYANGFLFSVDEESDPVLGFPGWLTYISSSADRRIMGNGVGVPSGFLVTDLGDGSIIEFGRGVDRLSVLDANALAEYFERSSS